MLARVRLISLGVLLVGFGSFAHASAQTTYTENLQFGMTSGAVSAVQECLASAGYFQHDVTTYFGPITLASLKAWQTAHAIPSTGFFGPLSRAAANGGACTSTSTPSIISDPPTSADPATIDPTLQSGITINEGKLYWIATGLPVQLRGSGSIIGDTTAAAPVISVSLAPATTTVFEDATTTFVATVTNATTTAVTWSASGGSIDANGVFTAPLVSATSTYTVTATSQADNSKAATSTVTVPPIIVSVSPASTTIAGNATTTFAATVANATTSAVTWSATGGSIDSNGLFTAPSVVATTTYSITASSTVDASHAGTASITVNPVIGLIDEWPLDINDNAVASDTVDSANSGTWSGTQIGTQGYYATGWESGLAGDFDGSTDYVSTPATYSYSPTTSFTWSAWVYVDSGNNGDVVILGDRHTSDWIKLTPTAFEYATGSIIDHSIPNNTWEFIAITDSAGSFTYYQNGSSVGTGTDTSDTFSDIPFSIGTDPVGESDGLFHGQVGDVRVYNTGLTQTEVQAIYNATK